MKAIRANEQARAAKRFQEDFQFYTQWAPKHAFPPEQICQREAELRQLQANQNPFTEELLQQLRKQ